ncbi:MAG: FimV family protein [Candidatus Sericytochromatia bacterium]
MIHPSRFRLNALLSLSALFGVFVLPGCNGEKKLPPTQASNPAQNQAAEALVANLEARLESLRNDLQRASTRASNSPAATDAQPSTSPEGQPGSEPNPGATPIPAPGSSPAPPANGLCSRAGKDSDQDGLSDACETILAETYAPVFYHSSQEKYFPTQVDAYLKQTALWFWDSDCDPDLNEQLQAFPVQSQLLTQTQAASCKSKLPASSQTTRSKDKVRSFYLKDLPEEARKGSSNTRDWITYVHAYPNTLNGATLQYWRFYAYHSGDGDHGGDWVGVHIVLDSVFKPLRVGFAAENEIRYLNWRDLEREGENRVRLYSYPESHLVFTAGKEVPADGCKGLGGFFSCRMDPAKPETFVRHESWKDGQVTWFSGDVGSSGGLLNLGERSLPLNGQSFIQYAGLWGSIGKNAVNSGDYGPAYSGIGMLSNGYLGFWAAGMLNPKREDAYPLAVSP